MFYVQKVIKLKDKKNEKNIFNKYNGLISLIYKGLLQIGKRENTQIIYRRRNRST